MEQAATIAEEQALIADDFELFDDWRERIEYVLDLGRRLQPLPAADYAEANKVTRGVSHGFKLERAPVADRRLLDDASSQANLSIVVRSVGVVEVECNLLKGYLRRDFTPKEKDGTRLMRTQ